MSRAGRGWRAVREQLAALEQELDPFVRSRARALVRLVPRDLVPDVASGRITWRHEHPGGRPCSVTLVPQDGGRLAGECTCDTFMSQGQCKHVAALVARLLAVLSNRPAQPAPGEEPASAGRRVELTSPGAAPALTAAPVPGSAPSPSAPSPGSAPAAGSVPGPGADPAAPGPAGAHGRGPGAVPRGPAPLTWRVRLKRERIDVVPCSPRTSGPPAPLSLWELLAPRRRVAAPDRPAVTWLRRRLGPKRWEEPPVMSLVPLLARLVGHPCVDVEGKGRVALARGQAGVVAVAAGERFALRPALDGHALALWPGSAALVSEGLVGVLPGTAELRFAPLSPEAVALLRATGAQAAPLEVAALLALVERVEQAETGLAVHLPERLRGREVAPSGGVVLRVAPRPDGEAGADLALRTRPIAGGAAFLPGEGEPRVAALVGGERLVARRDLGAEVAAAAVVLAELGLGPAEAAGPSRAAAPSCRPTRHEPRKPRTPQSEEAEAEAGPRRAQDRTSHGWPRKAADHDRRGADATNEAEAEQPEETEAEAEAEAEAGQRRAQDRISHGWPRKATDHDRRGAGAKTEAEAGRDEVEPAAGRWDHSVRSDDLLLGLLDRFHARFGERPDVAALEWAADAVPRRTVRGRLELAAEEGPGWFDLSGGLRVEGEVVPLAVFLAEARAGRRWAAIGGGQYVELRALLGGRLLDLALLAHEAGGASPEAGGASLEATARFPRAALAALGPALSAAPPASPGLDALVARSRAGLAADAAVPGELRATLRPYQAQGFRWLARLAALGAGACLADEVGLGKTVQAIALLLHRRAAGPALVFAPTSVVFNWERELRRFAPSLRVHVHQGAGRMDRLDALGPGDVLVSGWALLARDVEWLELPAWGTLVLDEAQALKNKDSHTARAARRLRAGFSVALSATPLENDLGELWSVVHAAAPGLLGTWPQFQGRFAVPIEHGDAARRDALRALLRPFLLRRTQAQVLAELPPRTEARIDVTLSGAERAVYERQRLDTLAACTTAVPGGPGWIRLLGALTLLREAASHARLVDPQAPLASAKLRELLARLEPALAAGRRALVFSQFVRHLLLARDVLAERGIEAPLLRGSTPAAERAALVDAFQRGAAPVFLVSLKAGGTGLNLTAADVVVHLDPWWNPAAEEQATGRAHRLGQERPVTVWRLVARGTIEEQVLELQERKRRLAQAVLEGADGVDRVSPDELLALLREAARPPQDASRR